jgi:hypothetical protein
MSWRITFVALLIATAGSASAANIAETQRAIDRIKAVGKEAAGNQEAGAAWKELVSHGGEALVPTLAAMRDASPAACNWLRSAVNAIAEKEKATGKKLPIDNLEAFLKDTKNLPAARRLAYEILVDIDAKTPDRLLPGLLHDPSTELRRDAVGAALTKAEKLTGDAAKAEYTRLLAAVRDEEQANKIADALDKLGARPNLKSHFGIVTNWMLAGPFDSTKGAGFEKPYEPEKKVDLAATYKGKGDAEVKWVPHTAEADPPPEKNEKGEIGKIAVENVGLVKLNKALAKHKDAVAYAYTLIESDKEQPVEVRLGCINAIKVFLNGKEVFAREEYHHGMRFDQYVGSGTLKPGKNEILVKVCQNDQKEPWAQDWQFQLRLSDATGGALPVKEALSTK